MLGGKHLRSLDGQGGNSYLRTIPTKHSEGHQLTRILANETAAVTVPCTVHYSPKEMAQLTYNNQPSAGEVVYLSGKVYAVHVSTRPTPGSIKFHWPGCAMDGAVKKAITWFRRKTEGREDVL